MKQTFKIPEGCESVTIEQIGNQLITTFEPLKQEFKRGDIVKSPSSIFIYSGSDNCIAKIVGRNEYLYLDGKMGTFGDERRPATEPEKQLLFSALAKKGKQWNAEKLCIEDLKYIPKVGDCVKVMDGKYLHTIGIVHDINEYLVYFEYPMIDSDSLSNSTRRGHNKESYIFEQLTPDQFQAEFEKLGYIYDFETHTAEKKRWRAKDGEDYYYIDSLLSCDSDMEVLDQIDFDRYNTLNYFQTKPEAKQAAEFLKQQLKEYLSK